MRKTNFYTGFLILLIVAIIIIEGCTPTKQKEVASLPNTKTKESMPIQHSEPGASETTKKFLTYSNPSDGIKIKYPVDWVKEDLLGGISYYFHPQNRDDTNSYYAEGLMITLGIFDDSQLTLEEYTKKTIDIYKSDNPDWVIIDSSKATLAGSPAHKFVVTYKDGDFNVKSMFIWTIKNGKPYIIAYTAEQDKYVALLRTAQEMINSLKIT